MSKVVGAVVAIGALASMAVAQEIGRVTLKPNPRTGEMYADLPARPDGEPVYIVRSGKVITEATIKSSGKPGGTVISVPQDAAAKIRIGDRISLSPDPNAPMPQVPETAPALPAAVPGAPAAAIPPAIPPLSAALAPNPLAASPPSESAAALPALPIVEAAPSFDTAAPATTRRSSLKTVTEINGDDKPLPQLEKGVTISTSKKIDTTVEAASPRLTPRGTGVTVYPRPAVTAEAGILGPYGVGLAAAAPVGTPYLRSPAFAGPPVIYMPQTVTRVLLPGVTPYPANIMAPPTRYAYASAPFTRTDIYVSLPYGTFYWPQGYAGTTPVEPQVPAYVLAPASAIMTNEGSYAVQRYAPGLANPETLSPITVAAPAPVSAAVAVTGPAPATIALTPAPVAAIAQIPAVAPGQPAGPIGAELSVAAEPTPAEDAPALQPLSPFPGTNAPPEMQTGVNAPASVVGPAPLAVTPAPTPFTEVNAQLPGPTPVPALPPLGAATTTVQTEATAPVPSEAGALPALPALPGTNDTAPNVAPAPTPAGEGGLPSLPGSVTAPATGGAVNTTGAPAPAPGQ